MIQSSHTETTALEITDIIKITPRGITVVVKETGKELNLPVNHVDFMPGLAIIPAWLFRKIYNKRRNKIKTISLCRSDFKEPTAEANMFEDIVLESLGIPEDQREDIDDVDITVHSYEIN